MLTYTRNSVMAKLLLEGDLFGAIEPFRPVIDGIEFTDQPLNLFKTGKWQAHKELMIGTNQEEMAQISAFFESLGIPLPKALFEVCRFLNYGTSRTKSFLQMPTVTAQKVKCLEKISLFFKKSKVEQSSNVCFSPKYNIQFLQLT